MTYTVKPGDTLSTIARDVLGNIDLWRAIAEANNIVNPNFIFPGQVLTLPEVTKPAQQQAGGGAFGWLLLLGLIGGTYWATRKKKQLGNINEIKERYDSLTDNNDHTGAALLLVNHFGTASEKRKLKEIEEKQNKRGHITEKEQNERDTIARKYFKRLR